MRSRATRALCQEAGLAPIVEMLLRRNMGPAGANSPRQLGVPEVADATVRCLRRAIPAAVPGVVFLSGGQNARAATAQLNATNATPTPHPCNAAEPSGPSFTALVATPRLATDSTPPSWRTGRTDPAPEPQS